jgi:hypothetical protein
MSAFLEDYLSIFLIAALSLAAVALLLAGYLWLKLKHYRRDQKVIIGKGHSRDLVAHSRAVQEKVDGLARDLMHLTEELKKAERRLDDCLIFRSVVRYDAYRDLSGMQSTSIALLDAHFSGVVISAIQSRDHARIYVKEVRHGESKEKLSPEEIHVLKEAMGLKSKATEAVGGRSSA